MRLQQQLALAILPAILAPLLLIGGASYRQIDVTVRDRTLAAMQTAGEQLAAAIEADIVAATTSVGFLAISSPLTTYVTAPDEDSRYGIYQPNVLALLTDYQAAYPANLGLQLRSPDGLVDIDWSRDEVGPVAPQMLDDFAQRLRTGAASPLTQVLPAAADGRALLVLGTAITDAAVQRRPEVVPATRGYLIAVFDLRAVSARADALRFGTSGGVLLADERGRPWGGSARQATWNPAASLSDAQRRTATAFPVEITAEGTGRYVSVHRPHPQLLAIGSVARSEVSSVSPRIALTLLVLTLLVIWAMHRLVYITVRRVLLTPTQSLIGVARSMASGQLQTPVDVDSADELGDLGRALRDLGTSLSESQASAVLRESEREQAVVQMKAARDRAEAASRSKSEFLARMSHEIRTPMNGVLGMTELLGGTKLEFRQRQYTETIRQSAEALLAIINDVLDFSKMEAGRMELDDAPFDLEHVVEEAAELLAGPAHAKGLELVCKLPPGLHTAYRGDGMRLRQVLINLLGNAVKFTEQGQVMVQVNAVAGGDATHALLRFEVKDTGIGIRPQNMGLIFEFFSQEDGSTTRKFGGTGLGLAISKQLVELMGGKIGATSTPGEGSTFWFTVPMVPEHPANSELRPEALIGSRILVVDDNEINREILSQHLKSWHVEVTEAATGPQALARLQEAANADDSFDLVVLDYQMPGMSGMDVIRAVRSTPALRDLSIVLLSSVSRVAEETDWRAQCVAACLTKPVRRSQLHEALKRLLSGSPSDSQITRTATAMQDASAVRLGLKVLLVEDNAVNREVARGMLDLLGCEVTLAGDGIEGASAFESGQYDVVLMDCHMPGLDGYGATRRIRAWENTSGRPRTPVVALTANALEGDREKCLAAGMDDYLSKPFTADQLRRALDPLVPASEDEPIHAATGARAEPAPSPHGASGNGAAVLNDSALAQIRALQQPGGPNLLDKVIALYMDSSQSLLEKVRDGLAAGDARTLSEAAHALKSSSANVGATSLAEIARQLEASGREADLSRAQLLAERLFHEHRRVVEALSAERAAA
jgi:signal transduction histidine kinase/CheY-like chemotaxis protein/HPt (histidine-containing phosphotransfer) domain-containing protein